MYFKIVNKNKIASSGSYELSNIQSYAIDEGMILKENYNETLDSATLKTDRLYSSDEPLTSKIDIEPFDRVILYNENGSFKTMLVDNVREIQVSANPKIYAYEITLFSLIKELEGILLPNLAITRLYGTETRSIGYYLAKYLEDYGPKIRVGGSWVKKYNIDATVQTYFNSIDCPEMQWNQPTLREVLNDLMMVKDRIPYIDGGLNTIKCIDLTEKKSDISSDSYINRIEQSRDSTDYVSELKMNLVNAVQGTNSNIKNTVSKKELITFTTENDYVMNTDNIVLKTKFPIYKIKHLWMIIEGMPTDGTLIYTDYGGAFIKVDLCNVKGGHDTSYLNMVFEEEEWKTKSLLYRIGDLPYIIADGNGHPEFTPFSELERYQNTTLHFVRGSNVINGFNNLSTVAKFLGIDWEKQNLELYCNAIMGDFTTVGDFDFPEISSAYGISTINMDSDAGEWYKHTIFQIEYETTMDAVFTASKDDYPSHKRTVIDNQTNSYTNPEMQGDLEYQKANRLGNPILFVNAIYPNSQTMLKIGDYYEDSVIYQVEYQFYNNYVNVNAYGTKDYILKNYFTGVKARIRSWRITDGHDALTRHNLEKVYCEFSYNSHEEYGDPFISYGYIFSPFLTNTVEPLEYSFGQTKSDTVYYPVSNDSTYVYIIDFSMRLIGNSIVLTTGYDDNYQVGKGINTDKITISQAPIPQVTTDPATLGGIPLKQHRYVNDDGECDYQRYWFFKKLNSIPGETFYEIETGTRIPAVTVTSGNARNTGVQRFFNTIYRYPVTYYYNRSGLKLYFDTHYLKDNKEILMQSIQFEFCSDTTDIRFTKAFIERQEMIRNVTINTSFKIRIADESTYNFKDVRLPSSYESEINVSITTDENEMLLTLNDEIDDLNGKAIFLCDDNDVVLLAFKNVPDVNYDNTHIALYLNILKERDKNIYNSDNIIVDKI